MTTSADYRDRLAAAFVGRLTRELAPARTIAPDRPMFGNPREDRSSPALLYVSSGDPPSYTVGEALALVESALPRLAEALAAEVLDLAAEVLNLDPTMGEDFAGAVLDRFLTGEGLGKVGPLVEWWPLSDGRDDDLAARFLRVFVNRPRDLESALPTWALLAWDMDRGEVNRWAVEAVRALAGDEYAEAEAAARARVDALFPVHERPSSRFWTLALPRPRGARVPSEGIAALWFAARVERLERTSYAYVAARAHAEVLELLAADPASPPPAYAEAVRAELAGFAAESDHVAGAVLREAPRLAALAAELLEAARLTVGPIFAGPAPASEAEARESSPTAAGPALRWDAAFADALDALGGAGRERAAAIRSAAAERFANPDGLPANLWRLWRSEAGNAPRWLRNLVRARWHDAWRPAIERDRKARSEAAREATPAHPVAVVGAIRKALSTWSIEERGGRETLLDRDGAVLADLGPRALTAVLAAEMQRPRAGEIRSVDTHRFLLWFFQVLNDRKRSNEPDFRVVRVDGRWHELAARVGGDREVLSRVVPYLARLPIPGHRDTVEPGNLYAFDPGAPPRGRRQGWISLTAGTMLHPAATTNRLPWDRSTLPIPGLPPMARVLAARGNEHGQIATLRLLTVARLEAAGSELVTEGGAAISGEAWLHDLNAVGLRHPIARWERLVAAWVAGGDDAPPFLVEIERPRDGRPGRYHLHPDHHVGARAYLDRGAEMSLSGKERAKKRGRKGIK